MAVTKINLGTEVTGVLPAASEPAFTGDVTKTVGSVATIVKQLNGVALSGLATGILKNTTTTGVPSIAVAGTDFAGIASANTFAGTQTFSKALVEAVTASAGLATSGTIGITNPVTIVTPTAAVTGVI